jgi:hypothetical protein
VRRVLGFDGDEDVRCPLPGHCGIAWLEPLAGPQRELMCDCLGRTAEWGDPNVWRSVYGRALSDAYHAVRTGQVIERTTKPLSKGERLVWSLLLAHAVGVLEPAAVALRPLPPDASEVDHRARAFFRLLAGLRLAWMRTDDALPMPFAGNLLADYLGIGRSARAAINALREHHVIEFVGWTADGAPYLFAPEPA